MLGMTGVPGPSEADKLPSRPSLPKETTIAFALIFAALEALVRPSEEEEGAGGALMGGSRVVGVGRFVDAALLDEEDAPLVDATAAVAGSSSVRCAGNLGRLAGEAGSIAISPWSCSVVPFEGVAAMEAASAGASAAAVVVEADVADAAAPSGSLAGSAGAGAVPFSEAGATEETAASVAIDDGPAVLLGSPSMLGRRANVVIIMRNGRLVVSK